ECRENRLPAIVSESRRPSGPAESGDDGAMAIEVEVNLRVPSLTLQEDGQHDRRVDNRSVRFVRLIRVERVPKRDEAVSALIWETAFDCTVPRCDWSDDKNVFVASCVFGRRTITRAEYEGLMTDPDWTKHELPA